MSSIPHSMTAASLPGSAAVRHVYRLCTALRSRAGRRARLPLGTLLLAIALILVWVLGANEALQYERTASAPMGLLRGFTSHLTHWSTSHLAWNVLGCALLGGLCERRDPRAFWLVGAGAAIAIGIAVQLTLPEVTQYRGASGLASAYFGWLCPALVHELWHRGQRIQALCTALLALAFAARCALAWSSGELLLASIPTGTAAASQNTGLDVTPVPLAHAVGLAVGLAPHFARCVRRVGSRDRRLPIDHGIALSSASGRCESRSARPLRLSRTISEGRTEGLSRPPRLVAPPITSWTGQRSRRFSS